MNDKIPSKFLNKHPISSDIELIVVESRQNKRKWLDSIFVTAITAIISKYSVQYEQIVIFGDFNMSVENSHSQNLIQIYNLSTLIKEPACFQSHNLTWIDNFLTSQKSTFKLSRLFETSLSDHHELVSVVMKSGIFRGPPRRKVYRSYKNVDSEHFNIALKSEFEKLNNLTHNAFETAFCTVLNKHAPIKVKVLRHNSNTFITKNLRKAIMQRS